MSIDAFSIGSFINILKHEDLFDIIKSSKEAYGQDFSIIFCEELNQNLCGNCKRLVKEYMPSFPIDIHNLKNDNFKGKLPDDNSRFYKYFYKIFINPFNKITISKLIIFMILFLVLDVVPKIFSFVKL